MFAPHRTFRRRSPKVRNEFLPSSNERADWNSLRTLWRVWNGGPVSTQTKPLGIRNRRPPPRPSNRTGEKAPKWGAMIRAPAEAVESLKSVVELVSQREKARLPKRSYGDPAISPESLSTD